MDGPARTKATHLQNSDAYEMSDEPLNHENGEGGLHIGETVNDAMIAAVYDPCDTSVVKDADNKRGSWASELDFILACVGFAVGLGNIWRFPYLCYKNGGGAFLIPYITVLATCGIPLFLLELGLGQYMSLGSIGAWKIVPAFYGIGVASVVITFLMNIYYIVILAWSIFYLWSSFSAILPWSTCDNYWNTPRCFINGVNSSYVSNTSMADRGNNNVDAVVEFWERRVIQISDGIDSPGSVVWELAVCLLLAWILVYFCVWKGVRWSGKVVYITATFPYLILTVLVIRGVTLDGAADGLIFYLKPDLTRLSDMQVWIDSGTQIFFSYAIALGAMITLGSYNKFNNNFYKDCFIIASINSCTSLFGVIAVFSVLGFMAKEQNVTIAEVAESGPGLVFIAYPKAVTQMPLPQLWAVLFFIMILLVGIDSQFVAVEGFLTPLFDMFPQHLYDTRKRMLATGAYCLISYILGLCMVTEGGMYVFQLFDYYSASGLVLLWVCFFEAFVLAWIFGTDHFMDAIEHMIGRRISGWFVLCWKFITPSVTMGLFLLVGIQFTPLTYNKTYEYPPVAQGLGLCLVQLLWSVYRLCLSYRCYEHLDLYIRYSQNRGSIPENWSKTINTNEMENCNNSSAERPPNTVEVENTSSG